MGFTLDWSKQKIDWLLIVLLGWSIFLWDVSMNKVSDLGIDYGAHLTKTIIVPMVLMMWIGGIGVLIFTGILATRAITNRKGFFKVDIGVAIFALTMFAFLLLGGILQVVHVDEFPFFTWVVKTITFYHLIPITGYLLSSIYFVITE